MTRPTARTTLVGIVLALVATLVPPSGTAPAGAQDGGGPAPLYASSADRAAAWLVARFDADGETWTAAEHADLIFALAATNGSRSTAIEALELMEAATPAYVQQGSSWNFGGVAKVMLAAQTLGADIDDFGGFDLEAILRDGIVASGGDTGRIGTSNTFTQPLGIMALDRTSDGAPASTVTWLAGKQCPDGGFSWGACTQADADYTGLAASALHTAGNTTDLGQALDWLEGHQRADGGFHASNAPTASNTNSTGLAVQALRAAGRSATVVSRGAEYVYEAQKTTNPDRGAIPWQPTVNGSLFLATTQGVLAWGAPTYAELAFPTVEGEPCPPAQGVTVVLDLAHFDDTIQIACAPGAHASGTSAMRAAGFTIGWHPQHPGGGPGLGGAVCQLEGRPSTGYPACWFTGFWSYWHARPDAQWVYSNCGIDNRTPRQGTVEGWRYEPDVDNHIAAAPLTDVRFPRVTVDAPDQLEPGATATIEVTVARTAPRVAPAPGADPEPCSLPPHTAPEADTPTITGPVPGGLVEVRIDGEPAGAPLEVDPATGTVGLDTVIPAGDHEITVHYLGTATDLPAPSVASSVLVAPPTTTTLTADPTTAPRGDDVGLTATVETTSGAPVADGQVELRVGDEPIGDPVDLDATGEATVTTSFDEIDDIGEVEVTAHHLGSTAGLPSSSTPVTITVEEGETETLVRALYQAVLGRQPDTTDLGYWVRRFEAGTSPEKLAESLARTREGWSQVVRQHYRLALNRNGDAGGVTFWTDKLQRTKAPDTLLTDLFATPEVFDSRGDGTNRGFVTYLYSRVINRAPDATGLAYWVDRLDTHRGQASIGRKSAARSLVFTPEAITRQVQANHEAVCGVRASGSRLTQLTDHFEASRLNPSTLRAAIVIRGCP